MKHTYNKMKDLRKIQEFFSKPTEDKIDTITMDIPLFIRSLEYAREDAKDDMDLHNMAEKAIKGTKQKGILSMVDYDNLTQQKIKEVIQQVISEEKTKRDRCLRIADRKFDKPSAYKSGAVVRCRKGKIWKKLKEEILSNLTTIEPYNDPDDEYSQDLAILKEDESLHKWFKRQGPSGKEGGWVDCNTCRTTDGKTKCKACGRKKGEKRSKYPSCRPTAAKCKDKGKGKTWGKTK
jgi:hypothetical protein